MYCVFIADFRGIGRLFVSVFRECFGATDPALQVRIWNFLLLEESFCISEAELLIFPPRLLFNRNRKVVDYSQFQESDDAGK